MKSRWTKRALSALTDIHSHIAADNQPAADVLRDRALSFVEATLLAHPLIGRPGRVDVSCRVNPYFDGARLIGAVHHAEARIKYIAFHHLVWQHRANFRWPVHLETALTEAKTV